MSTKPEQTPMTARELRERLTAIRRRPATSEQIAEYNKIVERDSEDSETKSPAVKEDNERKIARPPENEL